MDIKFTDEEFEMLREFIEGYLVEYSPTPNGTMKSLVMKLQLSNDTLNWIERISGIKL